MIFLIVVVIGALAFLLTSLTPEEMQARRDKRTQAALVQARDALIGYAVQYREQQRISGGTDNAMYGYLPLPDFGESFNRNADFSHPCATEGCAKTNATGLSGNGILIGRFPWKTLGTEPLRDGYGECLWYAVAATHRAINSTAVTMNPDTLGTSPDATPPDILIGSGMPDLNAINAHGRPLAVIFSPGPAFDSGRTQSPDAPECKGNYDPAHYVNPALNNAQPAQPISSGRLFDTLRRSSSRQSTDPATRPPSFTDDINDMLDQIATCARDQIAANQITTNAKVNDACSLNLNSFGPKGYYSHYRDQVFITRCAGCQITVDNVLQPSCTGAVLFANQRTANQNRRDDTEKGNPDNYLEGANAPPTYGTDPASYYNDNLNNYKTSGPTFSGPGKLRPVRASKTNPQDFARCVAGGVWSAGDGCQTAEQDIVRCIPAGASLTEAPSALAAADDLIRYDPAIRTLTLGRQDIESDKGFAAAKLFGCAWTPEARATGSGFRSYFKFNIKDRGDGFVFAAVDGDRNDTSVCGAGEQHLGYSGNNTYTSPIAYPKIGLEFDTRKNYEDNPDASFVPDGFYPGRYLNSPWTLRTLANGRSDPDYAGYHFALTYWGSESPISTGYACWAGWFCPSPSFCDTGNICKLNQEEDDNVHGQLPTAPAVRPPPLNPPRIDDPATAGLDHAYYYSPYPPPYLPPALAPLNVSTDVNTHVRVEVERSAYAGRDDNSRLVKVVATASLASLAGLLTIDSIALQAGDTVLVTAQADARVNGVYVAAAGAWARAANADEAADLPPGTSWFIKEGSTHRGSLWRLQNVDLPVINSSALVIQRFREPVKATAATDITRTGLQTVDGVALAAGDRVLLRGQTDARQNGVYIAGTGVWRRAAVESTAAGMKDGAMWFSTSGSGSYWRLSGDAIPDTSNISIGAVAFPSNDLYSATLTTKVWKLPDSITTANQIARMKITTRSMNQLDPVVRYDKCPSGTCPTSNPDGQSCGGVETDGFRYCYTGQKPNLYDSKKMFDIRSTTSCGSNVSCSGNRFCGIDNVCYQPAFRTTRLGFTNSQSTSDQEIDITDFFTTWLP